MGSRCVRAKFIGDYRLFISMIRRVTKPQPSDTMIVAEPQNTYTRTSRTRMLFFVSTISRFTRYGGKICSELPPYGGAGGGPSSDFHFAEDYTLASAVSAPLTRIDCDLI